MHRLIASLAILLSATALAQATTWYVSPSGNDGGSCTQAAPCRTIDRGVRALSSGDTLTIQGGTYDRQDIGQYGPTPVPNGRSWETATTIAAAPGEAVWLKDAGISMVSGASYIIFDGLHIDNGALYLDGTAHHIRFQNGEFTNTQSTGANMFISGAGWNLEILNSKIHNAGGGTNGQGCTDPYGCYGMYWSGRDSLFACNTVANNGGYGFHIFHSGQNDVSNNIVRGNTFYGNNFTDLRGSFGASFILSCGPGNKAYNNVVYNNYGGIDIGYRCHGCEVYNNTVYGNAHFGISISGSDRVLVKNNIIYSNAGNDVLDWNPGTTVVDHNHTTASGDPLFVNAGAGDFHLQATSRAIDAGIPVGLPYAGPAPDDGAYEVGIAASQADCTAGSIMPTPPPPKPLPPPRNLRMLAR